MTDAPPTCGPEPQPEPQPQPQPPAQPALGGRRVRLRPSGDGCQRFMAVVSYDGTEFRGWQTQAEGSDTIQDRIEQRLGRVLGGKRGAPVAIAGSGRTDAGTHARRQVFHFDWPASRGLRTTATAAATAAAPHQATPKEVAAQLQRALRTGTWGHAHFLATVPQVLPSHLRVS
jgi:hypothetical protein